MKCFQKWLFCFFVIGFLFLIGCSSQEGRVSTSRNQFHGIDRIEWDSEFSLGRKINELSLVPGIDDTAVLVNGYSITKREIITEHMRNVHVGFDHLPLTLEAVVTSMIREQVSLQEASRLELQPSQAGINMAVSSLRRSFEAGWPSMEGFIAGMGITEDEYSAMHEKLIYNGYLINALADFVADTQMDEILAEAYRRDETIHPVFRSVVSEFFNKYVDELVEQASIEILDPEIMALFPEGYFGHP